MDNSTAERYIESNRRFIEAMGMHWANENAKIDKIGPLPYNEYHFSNLAHKPF